MKSILLASASMLVLAGAAAAEVEWSATATLGYNDTDLSGVQTEPPADTNSDEAGTWSDNQFGFYWELDIDVTLSQNLDNGLTAGATFGFEVADENLGQDLEGSDYVLFLESDTAGLFFGDTEFAAITHWTAAGDMEQDGFSEQDGDTVLRGDMMYAGIDASISYLVDGDELEQLALGATGTFGNFTLGMAYQEEVSGTSAQSAADVTAPANWDSDKTVLPSGTVTGADFNPDEIFGLFGSTAFAGADVTLAYVTNQTDNEDSLGLQVAYPFGPVTVTGYYVDESNGDANLGLNLAYVDGPISASLDLQDDQGTSKWALEGSYDVGNGVVVYAGVLNQNEGDEDYYLAGALDLGGGASLLVSYGVDDDHDREDEIGGGDYQEGLTVEAAFEF